MSRPRIATGPGPTPRQMREAIEAGGGEVVAIERADGLVWTDPADVDALRHILDAGRSVRWVQLPWAGVERFAGAGVFRDGRVWTCAKGVYAEPTAEHALALMLAGMRSVGSYARASSWRAPSGRVLYEGRVTIVGGGGICRALLGLLGAFRVKTTVVRRDPEPVASAARTVGPDRILDALRDADAVVLALSLTPETRGIVGREQLGAMKHDAWLVNVARGGHVVTDDLVDALRNDVIGGAALDVTDPEPLPLGHPLWDLDNCIITPHTANTPAMAEPRLLRQVTENVRRFGAGDELLGLVDPEAGY